MSFKKLTKNNTVRVIDLGLISYKDAWAYQTRLHEDLKNYKRNTKAETNRFPGHHLLICEHPHVYTLGRTGSQDHLLLAEEELKKEKVEFYKINRGGDITYHGPGQLVVYPILDLEYFYRDVHRYVRNLEEIVIRLLEDYNLLSERKVGYTGVWLAPKSGDHLHRKICAIGVHLSRWVSLHGLALNVNSDLNMFNHIIPCGISEDDKTVTSIEKELNAKIDMKDLKSRFIGYFEEVFECHSELSHLQA